MVRARTGYELRRDVVAIATALLHGVRRRHALAVAIHDQSGKQTRLLRGFAERSGLSVAGQLHLDQLPEVGINDRLVLAGVDLVLVRDLAAIDRVLQHQV